MSGFVKRYATPVLAQEALRRTRALRRQSVPTPAAEQGAKADVLVFERVEGQTGRALIGADMKPLLRVVRRLHAATVSGLPVFDPLLRIRPRLELTERAALRGLLDGPVPSGMSVLHGDLHVGQFIAKPSRDVWIVDLDDLALGPPEADLANFAAHLATTEPGPGIAGWATRVCGEWAALGGAVEESVFAWYLQLALLRRHLKLRAAGRPDHEAEILAYLRDSANFSMR